jgi:hypothetical protein
MSKKYQNLLSTMMMGDASSIFHNLLTGRILNMLINTNWIFQVSIQEAEVNINGCACVIDLSDSKGHKRFSFNSITLAFINDSLSDIFAKN